MSNGAGRGTGFANEVVQQFLQEGTLGRSQDVDEIHADRVFVSRGEARGVVVYVTGVVLDHEAPLALAEMWMTAVRGAEFVEHLDVGYRLLLLGHGGAHVVDDAEESWR